MSAGRVSQGTARSWRPDSASVESGRAWGITAAATDGGRAWVVACPNKGGGPRRTTKVRRSPPSYQDRGFCPSASRMIFRLLDLVASCLQRAEAPNGVCGERENKSRRIADDRSHSERDGFLLPHSAKGGTGRGRRPNRGSIRRAVSTVQTREANTPPRERFACPKGTRGGRDGFPDAVLDCSHLSRRCTSTATPRPARIRSGGGVAAARGASRPRHAIRQRRGAWDESHAPALFAPEWLSTRPVSFALSTTGRPRKRGRLSSPRVDPHGRLRVRGDPSRGCPPSYTSEAADHFTSNGPAGRNGTSADDSPYSAPPDES